MPCAGEAPAPFLLRSLHTPCSPQTAGASRSMSEPPPSANRYMYCGFSGVTSCTSFRCFLLPRSPTSSVMACRAQVAQTAMGPGVQVQHDHARCQLWTGKQTVRCSATQAATHAQQPHSLCCHPRVCVGRRVTHHFQPRLPDQHPQRGVQVVLGDPRLQLVAHEVQATQVHQQDGIDAGHLVECAHLHSTAQHSAFSLAQHISRRHHTPGLADHVSAPPALLRPLPSRPHLSTALCWKTSTAERWQGGSWWAR